MSFEPSVFLIENDPNPKRALCALLSDKRFLIREFATATSFLTTAKLDDGGCVVTDLRLPGIDGEQLQLELLSRNSPLSVVFLIRHADIPTTVRLMSRGAVAVLEKIRFDGHALLDAVESGLERSMWLNRRIRQVAETERRLNQLTNGERQVMRGMIIGKPIKRIARHQKTSMRTVDRRRRSVLQKMGASSIGELASVLARHSTLSENQASFPTTPPPTGVSHR